MTCLSRKWKFQFGIILAKISCHMDLYLTEVQKGIGKNTTGPKHQLQVDKLPENSKKQTKLCVVKIKLMSATHGS